MRRREFFALVGGAAAAWPIRLAAQGPARRIGVLTPLSAIAGRNLEGCFQDALRLEGWTDGQNVESEYRRFEGNAGFLGLADELVRLRPAVILAVGTPAAQASPTCRAAASSPRRTCSRRRAGTISSNPTRRHCLTISIAIRLGGNVGMALILFQSPATLNQRVAGSSPATPTTLCSLLLNQKT
jgi:hypothetical protein